VHVVDSAGHAFAAEITVGDGTVSATLDEAIERGTRETSVRLTVAQAIPKGRKMDLIVEKATELGVATIVPLRSDRVVGDRTGEHKTERWQRVAKTAAQQCDRIYIPWELADVRPLRETFDADAPGATSALFVIGPEGGFAANEVERAIAAGATAISLGSRILRTETVALVVLAAFAYARGEL